MPPVRASMGTAAMLPKGLIRSVVLSIVAATTPSLASADVIVVANRMARPVETQILPRHGQPYRLELAGGAVIPIVCEKSASLTLRQQEGDARFQLDANCAYFIGRTGRGVVSLEKIGLGGNDATWQGRGLPGETNGIGSIGVTLAVDEEEPAKRRVWEDRLRKRVARASDILEHTCRIRLEVARITTWESDDQYTDFKQSLAEFEQKVNPLPGRVAVGFTSQYRVPKGRTHLGGTRGPLFPHILIREWSQHIGEPERLELLVHELGHHLGAAHSPELDSVMRPMLGDRQSIRAGFLIKFDPVNALTMNLIAEEIRRRGIRSMAELTSGSKRRLRQIYGVLAEVDPDDKAPRLYRQLMNQMAKPTNQQ